MNVLDFINMVHGGILAGGPGSGRHPDGGNWKVPKFFRTRLKVGTYSIKTIPANKIKMREKNQDLIRVSDYADAMKKGARFPMIEVQKYGSSKFLIEEGHHRYLAHTLPKYENGLGKKNITVLVHHNIYGGGVGSGRHPYGRKEKPVKDKTRQKKAMASYVPMTKATLDLATANEKALANAIGAKHLGDHAPFDLIHVGKRIGIEVKSKMEGKHRNITMHQASLARKLKAAKSMKLSAVATVIFDNRKEGRGAGTNRIYYAHSLGSFKWKNVDSPNYRGPLKEVKNISEFKKIFGV